MMKTIAYTSTAIAGITNTELLFLAHSAQAFNATLGVTGLLVFNRGEFVQIIEGPDESMAEVYARITCDRLHHNIRPFVDEAITHRLFPAWAMLNSMEQPSSTLKEILQYALEKQSFGLTDGQVEAALRILKHLA